MNSGTCKLIRWKRLRSSYEGVMPSLWWAAVSLKPIGTPVLVLGKPPITVQLDCNSSHLFSAIAISILRGAQSGITRASEAESATLLQSFSSIVQTRTHLPLTLFTCFASIAFLVTMPALFRVSRGGLCPFGL